MPIPMNEVLIAEVIMRGIISGGGSSTIRTNFVFHFRRLATAVDPSKAAIFNAFNTNVATPIAAALNEDWDAASTTVRYPNDALDGPIEFSSALTGLISGDRLSSFAAAYLLMRTSLRGREYRGSKHLGPFSESDVTHATGCDIWNAACVARLQTIATAIGAGFTDATTNNWVPVILSRKLSQLTENPTTVSTADVVQVLVNSRVGSEVRRKAASLYA